MSRQFLILGAINCLLAVALGAFGAHGLQQVVSAEALKTWNTAVQYHSIHALGLLAIGIIFKEIKTISVAGWLLFGGIILFCGSLYLLTLTGMRTLGVVTPFGGLCFLLGWLWLAYQVFKYRPAA